MAQIGVREELKRPAAGLALEIVFGCVGGPVGLEKVVQWTSAVGQNEDAVVHESHEPAGEFEIFARLVEAEALHEPVALRACRHWTSVPLSSMVRSHADGASVMLT